MAARSPEKLMRVYSARITDVHARALAELARLHQVTGSELIRQWIDRAWKDNAEDLQKLSDTFAQIRKKKRAA